MTILTERRVVLMMTQMEDHSQAVDSYSYTSSLVVGTPSIATI